MDRWRPWALVAPGFEALDRPVDPGNAVGDALVLADEAPPAPYAAVEVRLDPTGGPAAAGLATAGGEHVVVRWTPATSRLTLELRRAGRTRVLRRRTVRGAAPVALGFALCESQVTGLLDTGDGWRPVLTERGRVAARVDLRDEDVLAAHRYAWGGPGARRVRAGVFGMTGLRDPRLVTRPDGTPYERDGRLFLTWTCAGLGFFQQAHWSVWSLDPADPRDLRLESQLFFRRDGLVLGDHAGQLVRDGDRWLLATSSWGDFAPGRIHVRHTVTDADLLTGVHVLDTARSPLPTRHGSWDPALVSTPEGWHVAFVESPSQQPFAFHPALARTTAADWTDGLDRVSLGRAPHHTEGPVFVTAGEETWLLASDGATRRYPVLGLDGSRAGHLDAPYPTNLPHPQLVPAPDGGWWLLTFDGTPYGGPVMGYGGHGDVVLMRAD